jgi:hypothetical protein
MTEAEWLACDDPDKMLTFIGSTARPRKQRLFACACCRTIWGLIPEASRTAVSAAEDHADGLLDASALATAITAAPRARRRRSAVDRAAYDAARSNGNARHVPGEVARVVASVAAPDPSPRAITRFVEGRPLTEEIPPNADRVAWDAAYAAHLRLEADLLRDIFGPLPFRPVQIPAGVLDWDGGIARRLAGGISDELAFDRLPILADALEEAGCTDGTILSHLRSPGPHVRGCWALDLVLGKK